MFISYQLLVFVRFLINLPFLPFFSSFSMNLLKMPHTTKTMKTRVKCLQDCILNYFGEIQFRQNFNVDFIPQWYIPNVRGIPKKKQFITPKQCREQLTRTIDSIVLAMTCADAMDLFFYILNPALLQSSQYIQRIPQKCWYCQAIIYINIAKGSTMQILLPEAAHPRYTGIDPIIAPTKVFNSLICFILVQTNRQDDHIEAPIAAVRPLYPMQRPPSPTSPSPMPAPRAIFGFRPLTKGLCEVRTIFLSNYTSMY